jgi:Glutamate-1-semialdehyde aminotransferase
MERLAPAGPVYQAGTLSGNPLATAAGSPCCGACAIQPSMTELERRGARLEAGLRSSAGSIASARC